MELWKIEQVGFSKDDLFEVIITAEEGTKLIAQVTIMSVANDIVEDHNRRIIKCVCCAANSKWFKFCPDCGRFLQPVCTCDKPQKGEMVDGFYCQGINTPNTACTGFVGVCAVYKHFSGFGFILLSGIYPPRPQTSNANRWADSPERKIICNVK